MPSGETIDLAQIQANLAGLNIPGMQLPSPVATPPVAAPMPSPVAAPMPSPVATPPVAAPMPSPVAGFYAFTVAASLGMPTAMAMAPPTPMSSDLLTGATTQPINLPTPVEQPLAPTSTQVLDRLNHPTTFLKLQETKLEWTH